MLLHHEGKLLIYTDHMNLKHVLDPTTVKNKSHISRLQRWAMTIQNYDFEICYELPTHFDGF